MNFLHRFEDSAIKRFNMHLFKAEQMMEIVDACEAAGLRIYGFDGFRLLGESIQPLMEYSPDYSDVKDIEKIYMMARLFLREAANLELLLEIVVGETENELI